MVDRAQLAGVIGRKKLFSGVFANKVRPLNLSSDTSTVSLKRIHLHPYGLRVKAARAEISCRSSGVSKNQDLAPLLTSYGALGKFSSSVPQFPPLQKEDVIEFLIHQEKFSPVSSKL